MPAKTPKTATKPSLSDFRIEGYNPDQPYRDNERVVFLCKMQAPLFQKATGRQKVTPKMNREPRGVLNFTLSSGGVGSLNLSGINIGVYLDDLPEMLTDLAERYQIKASDMKIFYSSSDEQAEDLTGFSDECHAALAAQIDDLPAGHGGTYAKIRESLRV
jgi:hypothetical protein